MKRILLTAALYAAFSSSAVAQEPAPEVRQNERPSYLPPLTDLQKPLDPPKPGIRKRVFDKKFLAVTALNVGVSIAQTLALRKCRQDHYIELCADGGYGEFKTREGLRQGLTGILVLTSWKIKQIEDRDDSKHKFWWLFQVANTGWNGGGIVQNASKHFPRDKDGT